MGGFARCRRTVRLIAHLTDPPPGAAYARRRARARPVPHARSCCRWQGGALTRTRLVRPHGEARAAGPGNQAGACHKALLSRFGNLPAPAKYQRKLIACNSFSEKAVRRRLTPLLPLLALLAGCRPVAIERPAPPPVIVLDTPAVVVDSGLLVPPPPVPAEEVLPAPPLLAREFRGAWVTPVWGGEWPSRPGLSPEAQRAELVRLLDVVVALGLNAVILHVRPAADALYPTARAPWSVYLTGVPGKAPEPWYDPLAFAVAEAHRRGLELHAWFNPFRASPPDRRITPAGLDVSRVHPELVVSYAGQRWLDPGIPAARRQVLGDILEVVDRYDIDGVHLDDYFYPYVEQRAVKVRVRRGGRTRTVTRQENIPFPDNASWRRYGEAAGFSSRSAWRRSNIDDFVASLYREVKARKPWVAVGISPFGIWRSGTPAGVTGLDAYSEIYADAHKWLREGWVDYLAPQLYWPLAGPQQRFTRLDEWWRQENVQQRHIWPGLHTDLEATGATGWRTGEIARQVETLRNARLGTAESYGHVHFRLRSLLSGAAAATRAPLRDVTYREPALVPSFPWLDATPPAPPRLALSSPSTGRGQALTVAPGDSVAVRFWLLQWLDAAGQWQSALHAGSDTLLVVPDSALATVAAVSAVSRTGIASAPAVVRLRAAAESPHR